MFNRIMTKIACLRSISTAIAVICVVCSLAFVQPTNASPSNSMTICAMDDFGQPMQQQQFRIFLYDEYGNLVNVSAMYSYQQGHVFDFLGEDIGVVQYQTGHVFDSLGNLIGYVVVP
jgi:hypothetical protein